MRLSQNHRNSLDLICSNHRHRNPSPHHHLQHSPRSVTHMKCASSTGIQSFSNSALSSMLLRTRSLTRSQLQLLLLLPHQNSNLPHPNLNLNLRKRRRPLSLRSRLLLPSHSLQRKSSLSHSLLRVSHLLHLLPSLSRHRPLLNLALLSPYSQQSNQSLNQRKLYVSLTSSASSTWLRKNSSCSV